MATATPQQTGRTGRERACAPRPSGRSAAGASGLFSLSPISSQCPPNTEGGRVRIKGGLWRPCGPFTPLTSSFLPAQPIPPFHASGVKMKQKRPATRERLRASKNHLKGTRGRFVECLGRQHATFLRLCQCWIGPKTDPVSTYPLHMEKLIIQNLRTTWRTKNRRLSWLFLALALPASGGLNIKAEKARRSARRGLCGRNGASEGKVERARCRIGISCCGSVIMTCLCSAKSWKPGGTSSAGTRPPTLSKSRAATRRAGCGISGCTRRSASRRRNFSLVAGGAISTGRNSSVLPICIATAKLTNAPAYGGRVYTADLRAAGLATRPGCPGSFLGCIKRAFPSGSLSVSSASA